MASLAIVEPHCSGHRMQYVRWVVREMIKGGYDLRLVTFPETLDHPLYSVMQDECLGGVQTLLLPKSGSLQRKDLRERPGISNLVIREFAYHRLFSNFFRQLPDEERPDFVFVPYLDYLAYAVALLGSPFGDSPWAGIVMRPSFHLEAMGIAGPRSRLHRPKRRLFLRLLRNRTLKRLFSIDEALIRYIGREHPEMAHQLRYLPDPAELNGTGSRESARKVLGIPDDVVVILVYGSLTHRKGIDSLMRAAMEDDFPQEVHILLAGHQDQQVRELLQSSYAGALRRAGRLHEYDRFLSDEEEYSAFRAANIVWMGYRGHYLMSGVLVQAGIMGLPVVACSEGVIGWLTRERQLGLDVKVDGQKAVAKAVATLACSKEASLTYGANGNRFAAAHTPENFCKALMREVKDNSPR